MEKIKVRTRMAQEIFKPVHEEIELPQWVRRVEYMIEQMQDGLVTNERVFSMLFNAKDNNPKPISVIDWVFFADLELHCANMRIRSLEWKLFILAIFVCCVLVFALAGVVL